MSMSAGNRLESSQHTASMPEFTVWNRQPANGGPRPIQKSAATSAMRSAGPPTGGWPLHLGTPLHLVNNGAHVTDNNQKTIFSESPVQVLRLPPTRGAQMARAPSHPSLSAQVSAMAQSSNVDRLFGSKGVEWKETTTQELGRLEIFTVRQLQRALMQKIQQSTRNPMGVWTAFHKLDRRGVQHLNFDDLRAAVDGFNLLASDELVDQLLRALDSDHDGVLSLPEFVAGLKGERLSLFSHHACAVHVTIVDETRSPAPLPRR